MLGPVLWLLTSPSASISTSGTLADAVCGKRRPSFHGSTIKYDAIIGHIQFNARECADGRSQVELNLLKNHYLANFFFNRGLSKRNGIETHIIV